MTCLRFVHAADLHLDSPFKGLRAAAPDRVASALYDATFQAYENIVELCIREEVDALLVAGDIYDGADRSLRAQSKFVDGLYRLHDKGIRSFVCHGNHDPLDGWEAQLEYPPSCHRFGPEFEAVPVFTDSPDRAVIHGISYPNRVVSENLVRGLKRTDAAPFSIGLLHTNVGGNPEHAPYAPCSLNDLRQSGVDYWALGHIHTRQILNERDPAVAYPGNPQGRHFNETGPRGVYLVEVDHGSDVRPQFRALDSVRWERIAVAIDAMETKQDLLDALHERLQGAWDDAGDRHVLVRVTLSGRGRLTEFLRREHTESDLAAQINDAWDGRMPFLWCDRVEDGSIPVFTKSETTGDGRVSGEWREQAGDVRRASGRGARRTRQYIPADTERPRKSRESHRSRSDPPRGGSRQQAAARAQIFRSIRARPTPAPSRPWHHAFETRQDPRRAGTGLATERLAEFDLSISVREEVSAHRDHLRAASENLQNLRSAEVQARKALDEASDAFDGAQAELQGAPQPALEPDGIRARRLSLRGAERTLDEHARAAVRADDLRNQLGDTEEESAPDRATRGDSVLAAILAAVGVVGLFIVATYFGDWATGSAVAVFLLAAAALVHFRAQPSARPSTADTVSARIRRQADDAEQR